MVNEKKKISVQIYNKDYTIVGKDNREHLYYVADEVDKKIREVARLNPGLDTTRKAVLTCCNMMDDYIKLQEEYEKVLKELKELKG